MASIYMEPMETAGRSPKELIGIYGAEIETCERLMSMSYTHSNSVKLEDRIDELEKASAVMRERLSKKDRK